MRFFLGLLQPSSSVKPHPGPVHVNGSASPLLPPTSTDKVYLEDFRVAFKHYKETEGEKWKSLNLQLPITFCQAKQTRIRSPGDAVEGDSAAWDKLEQDWSAFRASRGKEKLEKSGKAAVDGEYVSWKGQHTRLLNGSAETFWVDLVVKNPLEVDVTLSNLTVIVRETSSKDVDTTPDFVEVEVIEDVTLGPSDTRTVSDHTPGMLAIALTYADSHWCQMLKTGVVGYRACNVRVLRAAPMHGISRCSWTPPQ